MIRPVSPRDMWVLRRKPYNRLFLYDEAMLARGHNPVLFAARSLMTIAGNDVLTLVYRDGGLRGYIQARRRPGRPEADLVYLAALPYGRRNPPPTDPDVWYRLLERLVTYVGGKGIQRVYTSIAAGSPVQELLRQLGFQPYTTRQVWLLRQPELQEGSALVALRTQARRDAFAIQQLYESIAPRVVQHAEWRNSNSWHLPIARITWNRVRRKGWVLRREEAEGLDVAIQAWVGPSSTVLAPLIRPEARYKAQAALSYSVSQLPQERPIYTLLPTYQQELGGPLEELGFDHIGDQVLMVKSTTVSLRASLLAPVRDVGPEPLIAQTTLPIAHHTDSGGQRT